MTTVVHAFERALAESGPSRALALLEQQEALAPPDVLSLYEALLEREQAFIGATRSQYWSLRYQLAGSLGLEDAQGLTERVESRVVADLWASRSKSSQYAAPALRVAVGRRLQKLRQTGAPHNVIADAYRSLVTLDCEAADAEAAEGRALAALEHLSTVHDSKGELYAQLFSRLVNGLRPSFRADGMPEVAKRLLERVIPADADLAQTSSTVISVYATACEWAWPQKEHTLRKRALDASRGELDPSAELCREVELGIRYLEGNDLSEAERSLAAIEPLLSKRPPGTRASPTGARSGWERAAHELSRFTSRLGAAAMAKGNMELAGRAHQAAVSAEDRHAVLSLGRVRFQQGRLDEARLLFERYIRLMTTLKLPEDWEAADPTLEARASLREIQRMKGAPAEKPGAKSRE